MLKTLGAQIREFKSASLATPVFMILEVLMETIIPLMMASTGCLPLLIFRTYGSKIRRKGIDRLRQKLTKGDV